MKCLRKLKRNFGNEDKETNKKQKAKSKRKSKKQKAKTMAQNAQNTSFERLMGFCNDHCMGDDPAKKAEAEAILRGFLALGGELENCTNDPSFQQACEVTLAQVTGPRARSQSVRPEERSQSVRPEDIVVGKKYRFTLNERSKGCVWRAGPPSCKACSDTNPARGYVFTGTVIKVDSDFWAVNLHLDGYPQGTCRDDRYFIPFTKIDHIEEFTSGKLTKSARKVSKPYNREP